MPDHDGYQTVTVRLETQQVQYCKEHSINMSGLCRNLLRGYIIQQES